MRSRFATARFARTTNRRTVSTSWDQQGHASLSVSNRCSQAAPRKFWDLANIPPGRSWQETETTGV